MNTKRSNQSAALYPHYAHFSNGLAAHKCHLLFESDVRTTIQAVEMFAELSPAHESSASESIRVLFYCSIVCDSKTIQK